MSKHPPSPVSLDDFADLDEFPDVVTPRRFGKLLMQDGLIDTINAQLRRHGLMAPLPPPDISRRAREHDFHVDRTVVARRRAANKAARRARRVHRLAARR